MFEGQSRFVTSVCSIPIGHKTREFTLRLENIQPSLFFTQFPVSMAMVIGILTLRISLPEARSLKDKRMVIRSVKDRITHSMNMSVAEVGQQDLWQSGELAFVTVAGTREILDKRISTLARKLQSDPRYVILELRTEIL